jgi:hypothetical protein
MELAVLILGGYLGFTAYKRSSGLNYMNSFKFGIRMMQDAIRLLSILAAGERMLWGLNSDSISL